MKNNVILVNEKDEVIGSKKRQEITPENIIRITACWITNKSGKILLAQRSFNKVKDPGKWGPAVAGTVEVGETYDSNIIKEIEEELGLKKTKPEFVTKRFEHIHFVSWYKLEIKDDSEIIMQKEEVHAVKWFTDDELREFFINQREELLVSADFWLPKFINI